MKGSTKTKSLRLVGYARVSTDNQAQEGTIEVQEQALSEYARAQGHELVKVFSDEGVSGSSTDRLGLTDLYEYLEDHSDIDGVLITSLDRLTRSMRDQENIIYELGEEKHRRLISINDPDLDSRDPDKILLRHLKGMTNQYELSTVTRRLKAGRKAKAREGKRAGGAVPIGYDSINLDGKGGGKDWTIDPKQAETVRLIFHLSRCLNQRTRRRNGPKAIARMLNEMGIHRAKGTKWHPSAVRYILDNPIYKGFAHYGKCKVKRPGLVIH